MFLAEKTKGPLPLERKPSITEENAFAFPRSEETALPALALPLCRGTKEGLGVSGFGGLQAVRRTTLTEAAP